MIRRLPVVLGMAHGVALGVAQCVALGVVVFWLEEDLHTLRKMFITGTLLR